MREFHRIVVEQPKHMRGLIGDLLDTGRIESDTLSAAPEASEMVALAEPASSTFMSTARRHAVLIDLPAGLPPVMADRRRIVQVPQQPLATRRHAAAAEGATAGRGLRLASCKGSSWRPAGASGPTAPTQAAARHSRSRSRFRRPASPKPAANPDGPPRILVVHDPLMLRFVRRRALGGRLRHAPDGRAAPPPAYHPDREGATGPAQPGAASQRRHRADAPGPAVVRPADHLHLRLPPRRDGRAGAPAGHGRLHRHAVLADRAADPPARGRSDRSPSRSRSCSQRSPSTTRHTG